MTFIRGHEDDGKAPAAIDWTQPRAPRRNARLLCGLAAAAARCSTRCSRTADRRTIPRPWSTTARVRHRTRSPARCGEIAELVATAGDRRPAIAVVGRVVALREHLRWFDARPLFGKRILVTRPKDQAGDLVERLEAMGADAIVAPMIRIMPPEDYGRARRARARASATSTGSFSRAPTRADAFMERLLAGPEDLRALGGVRLCGVGPATAERLAAHGLKVDLTPPEYRAEAVLRALVGNRRRQGPADSAAARRHRPRAARRRAAQEGRRGHRGRRLPHRRGGSRARGRSRRLPHAARTPYRRRHVHERVSGAELRAGARRRAGGGSAGIDRRRVHRPGDCGGGGAVEHRHHDSAVDLHGPGAGRRASRNTSRQQTQQPDSRDHHDPHRHATRPSRITRRLRRLRRTPAMRALVRETRLSPDMFMLPLFVCEGEGVRREVPSMPGVFNLSVDEAVKEAAAAKADGVQERHPLRHPRPQGRHRIARPTIRKRRFSPRSARSSARSAMSLVATDVCLCEYTDHGHCGIVIDNEIVNDRDGRPARARGAVARRRRRRHRRAVGHDGRPRRRDPQGARRARLREHRDHGLRGEVLLGVLWAVPRRGGIGAAVRRPTVAPDGSGATPPRRCAKWSSTSRKAPTS